MSTQPVAVSETTDQHTQADDLVERLSDEADLCRNDGANDIADLLDEVRAALAEADRKNDAMLAEWNAAEARAAKAEEALRKIRYEAERENGGWVHLKRAIAAQCRETLGEEKA